MTTGTVSDVRNLALTHALKLQENNPNPLSVADLITNAEIIEAYIIGPAKAPLPDPNP